jgi:TPP-dependent pyruvate/acetoin dehydrogenase alpha subunit
MLRSTTIDDPAVALDMHRVMLLARRFEERLVELFAAGRIKGWIHSGLGQEATGAGAVSCLRRDDYLVPYFRSRVSLLAKGMTVAAMMAEICGRTTGCSRGLGGEAHMADPDLRILGTGGVIGSPIPIATGIAYAARMRGAGEVVLCGFGDGSTSEGAFHEAVNMAAVMALPIVFLCENNLYAEFSGPGVQMRVKTIAERAAAYGIPGVTVDGTDAIAVRAAMRPAIERARAGDGPTLVEALTTRWRGHYEGDPQSYRPTGETERLRDRDGVATIRRQLSGAGLLDDRLVAQCEDEVRAEIDTAVEAAFSAPEPTLEDLRKASGVDS